LAEGVAGWVPEPFSPFFAVIAELAVMLVGFFWLFELGRWETYLLVILNLAVLFGAYYVLGTMLDSPRSPMARPGAHARRSHR
jgi:hypothetical protein